MSNKSDFKVMDDREYMLHRPEIFIGSMNETETFNIYNYKFQKKVYTPSLVKIIEEIIDNSVDEAIRTNFKHANKIDVCIEDVPLQGWMVSVSDNGRGIPTVQHEGIYQAELAWTKPRTGSNFKDDGRVTIGRNGVGSACTNYFSKSFTGVSGDGKHCVIVNTFNNCERIESHYSECEGNKKGTMVTFTPDLERFGVQQITQDVLDVIQDRLSNLSICYPNIKFTFNHELIKTSNLNQLVKNFHESSIGYQNDNFTLVISPSGEDEEFRHLSYFNGICIKNGGSHIDYIIKGICDELIPMISRKWKVDVLPNQIKQHLLLAIWVRHFDNLKFDSQTKERITNTIGTIKEHLQLDFTKIANRIISKSDIIDPIVEAIIRKKEANEKRALTNATKKNKKKKFTDHIVANSNKTEEKTLFITEGQCFHEDTPVYTQYGIKQGKDIEKGDYVLTHKHRYRKVLSTSQSLKKGIKLNSQVYSPEHRLYVYDKQTDQFMFLAVKNLIKGQHQLVENNLVNRGLDQHLHSIIKIEVNTVYLSNNDVYQFSDTHQMIVLREQCFMTVTIDKLLTTDLMVI